MNNEVALNISSVFEEQQVIAACQNVKTGIDLGANKKGAAYG
jgi:hypothetical protein